MKQVKNLWCFHYDQQTYYKPFLQINFKRYLMDLITCKQFPQFEKIMANELNNSSLWTKKNWLIIQFFQMLNTSFEINSLDDIVAFMQDPLLRKTMGYFCMWIDLERLYLLCFLKLDRNEFQEDRIYMSIFRAIMYLNTLFNQYDLEDFDITFLKKFIQNSISILTDAKKYYQSQFIIQVLEELIQFFKNLKLQKIDYIDQVHLQKLRLKASLINERTYQSINQVQIRLLNQLSRNNLSLKNNQFTTLIKNEKLNEYIENRQHLYDMKLSMRKNIIDKIHDDRGQIYLDQIQQHIENEFKKEDEKKSLKNVSELLTDNGHNPFSTINYKTYSQAIKIDLQYRKQLQKQKQKQVVQKQVTKQKANFYYSKNFKKIMNQINDNYYNYSRIDNNDLQMKQISKENQDHRGQNQLGKLFNLKWHINSNNQNENQQEQESKQQIENNIRNYQNNTLFKNTIDQLMDLQNLNVLHFLKSKHHTTTTMLTFDQIQNNLHPQYWQHSFGPGLYCQHQSHFLQIETGDIVERTKFDLMRTVINFIVTQKKIKKLIQDPIVPQMCPRGLDMIKQYSCKPQIQYQKIQYAMEPSYDKIAPSIFL